MADRSPGVPKARQDLVTPVLEPETVEAAVAGFEEGDDRRQIIGSADAIGDVVAAALS